MYVQYSNSVWNNPTQTSTHHPQRNSTHPKSPLIQNSAPTTHITHTRRTLRKNPNFRSEKTLTRVVKFVRGPDQIWHISQEEMARTDTSALGHNWTGPRSFSERPGKLGALSSDITVSVIYTLYHLLRLVAWCELIKLMPYNVWTH